MRSRTGLVVLVMLALGAAACDSNTANRSSSPPTTQASGHPAEHQGAAPATTPKELAAELEQYFAQHTLIAVRQMRSVLTATPNYRKAADAELQEYTEELGQVVAAAYGDAQGDRFKQIWQRGITDFSSYADAVAANDASAKQQARAALLADADAYGSWLAEASNGRAKASDAATVMRTHVEQLMAQADAYAAHDFAKAYQVEREAY